MAVGAPILRQGPPTRLEIGDLDAECRCPNIRALDLDFDPESGPPTRCSSSAELAVDIFGFSYAVLDDGSSGWCR